MTPPDATTAGAWIVGVGAIALALLGVARLIQALWRISRSVSHFLEDWHGTPERPGRPAASGVPERLEVLEKRMTGLDSKVFVIEHEMHPNTGHSLRDKVDQIANATSADRS